MFKKIVVFSFLICSLAYVPANANDVVKPGAGTQACVNTTVTLNMISLEETVAGDFDIVNGSQQTLILEAASGTFIAGTEAVNVVNPDGISATISVTSTQIIITLTEIDDSNAGSINTLEITGVQYISNTPGPVNITVSALSTLVTSSLPPSFVAMEVNVSEPAVGANHTAAVCSANNIDYDLQNNITTLGNGITASIFSWVAAENPNVIGESKSPVDGYYITDNVINSTATPQVVVYTVTPSNGGCTGPSFTVTVTVNPGPSLTGASSVCQGNIITYNAEAGAVNYVWNQLGGTPLSGGTESLDFYEIQWNTITSTHVSVSYTNSFGCFGNKLITVTVADALPAGVNDNTPITCSHTLLNYDLQANVNSGTPALSTFLWSAADNTNVGGESLTPETTEFIKDSLINNTGSIETVIYTVTPTGACGEALSSFTVEVDVEPAPNTLITNNAPTISAGGTTNISLSSNVAGATFEYTYNGPPEISGGGSGSGSTISQLLDNSVTVQQTVTYTIVATANSCTGLSQIATVLVKGNPTISTADSVALVALYNATNGAGWTSQTNWLTGAADTWYGIGVAEERVTSVTLSSNNLTGSLPAGIYTLSGLISLVLNDNNISGALSAQIEDLSSLQVLDLSQNDFTGTIPTEVFNLTGLQTLSLSGKINGPVPSTIGAITALAQFSCDSCAITSLPAEVNTLTNLNTLSLKGNELTTLPDMSALSLTYLDVSKNRLTFESLEPNISISSFIYSPQDSVGTKIISVIQTQVPYSVTSSVGGSANQYQWKKNDLAIPGATSSNYEIASPVFEDEGTYIVEVTSSIVPGLTLISRPTSLRVSSLKRDSLSLVQLYNATTGSAWTNKTGWLTGNLSTWNGVTIASNRVTAINLPGNNLNGAVPAAISEMLSVATINLTTNKITALPDLTSLSQLVSVNVSSNSLSFGSLEQNLPILSKINYTNQADLGTIKQDTVLSGSTVKLKAITDGVNNQYQWKRNNQAVTGAADSTYLIEAISRTTMGEYNCEITNTVIPGLMIKSAPHTVLAYADLSGKLFAETNVPATKGTITLFRVTSADGYDTLSVKNVVNDGTFEFKKVVLDDYQLLGFADTLTYERALPTYYKKTIFWEEADTLRVTTTLTDLNIVSEREPGPPSGNGVISGIVEEDDGTGSGRVKKPKRVENAGVSARRVENTGRGKEEVLTLVAYVFTNAEGEFEITDLPVGSYRLNIQYPGYPMDENSFVTVPIGIALQSQVKVEAFVEAGKIVVRQLIITEISSAEAYKADVYPNPSHDFIELNFGTVSENREVGMFDTMGKGILNARAAGTRLSLDVQSLSKGNYLLHITENGYRVKSLHVIIE